MYKTIVNGSRVPEKSFVIQHLLSPYVYHVCFWNTNLHPTSIHLYSLLNHTVVEKSEVNLFHMGLTCEYHVMVMVNL